ncbi:hypothetical protein BGX26_007945, partial [Mortierella sp. AD094]
RALPDLAEAEENNRDEARAWFGEPFACMSIAALRMIHRTYELIDMKDHRLPTISWLENTATSKDGTFASVHSILRFSVELWLDDYVIDCALEELSMLDTGRNRFVLIPPQHLNNANRSISRGIWHHLRPKLEQFEQEGRSARLQEEWVLENFRNEHNHEPSNSIQQCSRPMKRLVKKRRMSSGSLASGLTAAQTRLALQNYGIDIMDRTIGSHNRVEIERYK